MSTATFAPVACRFAWKEYRMLRAFWLAVAVLTIVEQRVSMELAAPGSDLRAWLFGSALAAAVLYAAGAAATSFAVEHEEETYAFLAGLPATWLPVLIGKMLLSLASALALAAVLAATGWGLAGGRWPTLTHVDVLIGMLGVAILEAVAWGTLFSLLVCRPLVAAMLTLVVGILAVNIAVNSASYEATAALRLSAYSEVVPRRLAIVAAVLGCCVLLARRWLPAGTHRGSAAATSSVSPLAAIRASLSRAAAPAAGVFASLRRRTPRRPMLARLLWQTWRESWKLLLLPPVVTALLAESTALVIGPLLSPAAWGIHAHELQTGCIGFVLLWLCFMLPALYGAMAFHADQRRASYRFLADHAARPPYVWLARHVVWVGALAIVLLVIAIAIAVAGLAALDLQHTAYNAMTVAANVAFQSSHVAMGYVVSGTGLALFGALAAYAAGQLCSMLLRSGILAAFLALVLAVVLGAWTAVLFLWQLSGWLFLVPLAVGLLAATWLRAPGWIVDRQSWRGWTAPALAVAAPLVLVAVTLPMARLEQLPADTLATDQLDAKAAADNRRTVKVLKELDAHGFPTKRFSAEELETAQMYFHAVQLMWSWKENGIDPKDAPADQQEVVDQASQRLQELREKDPEAATFISFEALRRLHRHIEAEATRTADRYLQIVHHVGAAMSGEARQAAFDDLIAVTRRPRCQLPVQGAGEFSHEYGRLTELARSLTYSYDAPKPEVTLDHLLAGLRMCGHLREGQPVHAFMAQLSTERIILESVRRWAQDDQRTSDQLGDALEKLQDHFQSWSFKNSSRPFQYRAVDGRLVAVDRQLMRDVIEGTQLPLVLAAKSVSPATHLAYLANELPWERERALQALDIIAFQAEIDAGSLMSYLSQPLAPDRQVNLQRWLRPYAVGDLAPEWVHQQPAAATSWLVRLEYEVRVPLRDLSFNLCDTEMCRRATLLKIALVAYRRDHGQYPSSLADLVPDYFEDVPLDPYSGQPFEYSPSGLDLPLYELGYSNTGPGHVESHTPLFWSVGPENIQLARQQFTRYETDENAPGTESAIVRETAYTLFGPGWYHLPDRASLVFPLPK